MNILTKILSRIVSNEDMSVAKKSKKKATKRKSTKKKATKKKATKKKTTKKSTAKKKSTKVLSKAEQERKKREEAIKRYKSKNPLSEVDESTSENAAGVKSVSIEEAQGSKLPIDSVVETEGGFNSGPEAPKSDRLAEEYNPDDDNENDEEPEFGYGWGYNDAFDKPDEDEEEYNPYDEDVRYAKGIDSEADEEV